MSPLLTYKIIDFIFQIAYLSLVIRVLLSWIPHDPYNQIISYIYKLTDPIIRPFQKLIPPHSLGGIDVSPLFAFIALSILRKFIVQLLF